MINAELLQLIWQKLGTQNTFLELSPAWGDGNNGFRELLDQRLKTLQASKMVSQYSKSHSLGLGGLFYVTEPTDLGLGLDIEISSRVTDAITKRVSHQDESPPAKPSWHWCAKEACFKSLKPFKQPTVISELALTDWRSESAFNSHIEICSLKYPQRFGANSSIGVITEFNSYTISFFVSRP